MAQLDDPCVSAGTRREAGTPVFEQPMGDLPILDAPLDLPTGVQIAAPRQGDEALCVGPQFLSPRLGRQDPFAAAQSGPDMTQQRTLTALRAPNISAFRLH